MWIKLLCILLDFNTGVLGVLYKMRSGGEDLMVGVCSDARGCWFYTMNCVYVLPATFLPCQEPSLWFPSSGVSSSAGSGNGASFPSQKSRLFSRIWGFFIPIFPSGLLNINKSAEWVKFSLPCSATVVLKRHLCTKITKFVGFPSPHFSSMNSYLSGKGSADAAPVIKWQFQNCPGEPQDWQPGFVSKGVEPPPSLQ